MEWNDRVCRPTNKAQSLFCLASAESYTDHYWEATVLSSQPFPRSHVHQCGDRLFVRYKAISDRSLRVPLFPDRNEVARNKGRRNGTARRSARMTIVRGWKGWRGR
ncbi:hypothetical protein J6590_003628 [Homalodisca vitripennis]|nr:hypothetical protein J6590_003628 [Homalodisca vitripennis]